MTITGNPVLSEVGTVRGEEDKEKSKATGVQLPARASPPGPGGHNGSLTWTWESHSSSQHLRSFSDGFYYLFFDLSQIFFHIPTLVLLFFPKFFSGLFPIELGDVLTQLYSNAKRPAIFFQELDS